MKTQLVICLVTLTIICLAQAEGRVHDFQLFKDDIGDSIDENILVEGDSGYQGIEGLHAKSKIPIKKPRGRELLELEKAYNRRLARERVAIEHVNQTIKTFRILKDKYRNRRKSHNIRTTLLCAITNHELKIQKG
ncbi:MAG: transposase [Planctomycetaceae bacterium]|nr:transposase [Planctomycetaceae bacterium]